MFYTTVWTVTALYAAAFKLRKGLLWGWALRDFLNYVNKNSYSINFIIFVSDLTYVCKSQYIINDDMKYIQELASLYLHTTLARPCKAHSLANLYSFFLYLPLIGVWVYISGQEGKGFAYLANWCLPTIYHSWTSLAPGAISPGGKNTMVCTCFSVWFLQLESITFLFIMHLKYDFLCVCFNWSWKKDKSIAWWKALFWQAESGLSTSYIVFPPPSKYKIWDTHLYSKVHILSTILCKAHLKKYMQKCIRRNVCSKRPNNNFNPLFLWT